MIESLIPVGRPPPSPPPQPRTPSPTPAPSTEEEEEQGAVGEEEGSRLPLLIARSLLLSFL